MEILLGRNDERILDALAAGGAPAAFEDMLTTAVGERVRAELLFTFLTSDAELDPALPFKPSPAPRAQGGGDGPRINSSSCDPSFELVG